MLPIRVAPSVQMLPGSAPFTFLRQIRQRALAPFRLQWEPASGFETIRGAPEFCPVERSDDHLRPGRLDVSTHTRPGDPAYAAIGAAETRRAVPSARGPPLLAPLRRGVSRGTCLSIRAFRGAVSPRTTNAGETRRWYHGQPAPDGPATDTRITIVFDPARLLSVREPRCMVQERGPGRAGRNALNRSRAVITEEKVKRNRKNTASPETRPMSTTACAETACAATPPPCDALPGGHREAGEAGAGMPPGVRRPLPTALPVPSLGALLPVPTLPDRSGGAWPEAGPAFEEEKPVKEYLRGKQGAHVLEEFSAALLMHAAKPPTLGAVDATAFQYYRNALLARAGDPSDPIEVLLIEATAMTFLALGRVHCKSANATDVEAAKAFGSLAVAMTGELRRTALALKAYRTQDGSASSPGKGARQEPVRVGDPEVTRRQETCPPEGELGGKPGEERS
jgi:hypothetical protein